MTRVAWDQAAQWGKKCRTWSQARQEVSAIRISRLLLRMRHTYVASICLDFHSLPCSPFLSRHVTLLLTRQKQLQGRLGLPLKAQSAIYLITDVGPSITRNLVTRVLTICHAKHTQSTAMEQKRLDLRSFSPAFCNL